MITAEMDKSYNGFPNQETYGFCLWVGSNDMLHRIAGYFVNDDHVTPEEVQPLVVAMEFLSNAGGKVNSETTKVDSVFLADWLNEEFEPA